jgi:regulator of sigma E protease
MTPITQLPSGMAALFWGVITFSLLIVLHEGGHFLAARAFGVRVHEFMLGLPGPALRWRSKRSGVVYGVTAIPLGGYVRIAGMEPGPEDELLGAALAALVDGGAMGATGLAEAIGVPKERANSLLVTLEDYGAAEQVPDTEEDRALVSRDAGESDSSMLDRVRKGVYRGQPTWKRVTILAMGVLVNIVSAILILTLALSLLGVPTPIPKVAELSTGGAAMSSGMKVGDTVTALGSTKITSWPQLTTLLKAAKPGTPVTVTVDRGGATLTFTMTPLPRPGGGALLGIVADTHDVPMSVIEALKQSFVMTGAVFVAIAHFFDPRTFAESLQGARSVVGISYEVANAAQQGPLAYAWMISLLSLSLGIMNILPIPPLDGGKIAVEAIEAVLRRPIPRKLSLAASVLGTLLLFSLIFYLMYADVLRYIIKTG